MDLSAGTVILSIGSIVATAIGYLLARKDALQEKQIEDLYNKHGLDAERLQQLEIRVAADHYTKSEIMGMLDSLKKYLDDRFDRIERYIEKK